MNSINLLGIPYDGKSTFMKGPGLAPKKIRKIFHNGASNYTSENGILVNGPSLNDLGDIEISSYDDIKDKMDKAYKSSPHHTLALGGDHSITYALVKAAAKQFGKFSLLHIDAHADLYEEYEGDRFSHACPMARIMEENLVSSMTQIGIRTLNDHQRQQATKYNVTIIEMKDWNGEINEIDGPVYVTLDMDAFDPGFAPGVSHHEPGGFSPRQVISVVQNLKGPIIGADIVEYNPERDIHDMTGALAAKMLKEIAAKMISSNYGA